MLTSQDKLNKMKTKSDIKIGIDVDGTTLDSSPAWWSWLHHMTLPNDCDTKDHIPEGLDFVSSNLLVFINDMERIGQKISYDLTQYFPDPINHNVDKFEFWRHTGVYDTIQPVDGAVHCINLLIKRGYHIVFVTHNKGNGGRSKHMNLIRHFGYDNFDYVVTKEKHLVNVDCLIDDRNEFLNPCHDNGVQGFLLDTPFEQNQPTHPDVIRCKKWNPCVINSVENWIANNIDNFVPTEAMGK